MADRCVRIAAWQSWLCPYCSNGKQMRPYCSLADAAWQGWLCPYCSMAGLCPYCSSADRLVVLLTTYMHSLRNGGREVN